MGKKNKINFIVSKGELELELDKHYKSKYYTFNRQSVSFKISKKLAQQLL